MNDIERRNATHDAFARMIIWVRVQTKGLWDDQQTFTLSYKNNCLDWELVIHHDDVFIRRNITNFSDCIKVYPYGYSTNGRKFYWDNETARWKTNIKQGSEIWDTGTYGIDGMFAMANRWEEIKMWVSIRYKQCNKVLDFKL